MSTRYGGGKGKAKSHPPKETKPYWNKVSEKDLEKLIVDLYKDGNSPAKVGLILRDSYGIPKIKSVLNQKITKILEKNEIKAEPQTLTDLKTKKKKLDKHLEKNKKDRKAKRGMQLTFSKIRRLERYHSK
ncbi:MAG: 30S ribosomal protein S15 [archaeon]